MPPNLTLLDVTRRLDPMVKKKLKKVTKEKLKAVSDKKIVKKVRTEGEKRKALYGKDQ